MYITSKITSKLTAKYNHTINNRIDGDKEYKIECFIDDYLMPMLTSNYNNDLTEFITYKQDSIFKLLLNCDIELKRDGECNLDKINWYAKKIKSNLMKLDDITLTFLINVCILKQENL